MAVTFVNAMLDNMMGLAGIEFEERMRLGYGVSWSSGNTFTLSMSELANYQYYPNFRVVGADLYVDGVYVYPSTWTPIDGQTVTLTLDMSTGITRVDVVSPGGGGWFNDHHL